MVLPLRNWIATATGGMPRAFWVLWTGTLINKLGGFVLPFLALYLTGERGLTVAQAGLILSLYGVGSMVASPLGGVLSDRVGRKATMLLGMTLASIVLVLLGLATTLPGLVAAILAFGLVNDLFRPAVSAMIADLIPPQQRLKAYALLYWATNLGFAIAPILAGLLAKRSFLALFLVDGATTGLFAVLVWVKVKETRPARTEEDRETDGWVGFLAPFRDAVFLQFAALTLLVGTVFLQFTVALPVEMAARGIPPVAYGQVLAVNGLLIILLQPFTTRWLAPYRRSWVLAAAALLIGLGFGLTGLAKTVPMYAVSVGVWTLGEILMSPVSASVVADLAPTALRGRYQGAFHFSWSVSMFTGPMLGSWVMGTLGSGWLWIGCVLAGLLGAVGHLLIAAPRRARMASLAAGGFSAPE